MVEGIPRSTVAGASNIMSNRAASSGRTYLTDYQPPAFAIPSVQLTFDLGDTRTHVHALLSITRQGAHQQPLVLDGEQIELLSLALDGAPLEPDQWLVDEHTLTLREVPDQFQLEIETCLDPSANTALSGLYLSADTLCTQCEPEGFRRITYFLDRPDVLSTYRVTLQADRGRHPMLLANGNLVKSHKIDGGRHQATWYDPHPKPSYLFALVAGQLGHLEDRFITNSGRAVTLRVYAHDRDLPQCGHALAALGEAMRWDEQAYGREYDLDRYNIVAVEDFNMGAMENKGLNIFNTKYVLALPATATDRDYQAVTSVIGHEYFHNWSGNRVTLRDWFQLSLKEAFTVFRDQQFSAVQGSSGVKRIEDANLLRTQQFREDAGPMAHPVQPDSYIEINNFYTLTVYIKGAEIVRMLHCLLGAETFRKGCDLYFDRHDGQAVTTNEFICAMEDAAGIDLAQFRRWYQQAGTPRLVARGRFDSATRCYTLHLQQSCPATPDQAEKTPFHIPVVTALFGRDGKPLATSCSAQGPARHEHTLSLTEREQHFVFYGLAEPPVASVLRGFSAPVMLETDHSDMELAILMGHDDDPFIRWDAGQHLARKQILATLVQPQAVTLNDAFAGAFGHTLHGEFKDRSFQALALQLPNENYLAEFVEIIEPESLHLARQSVKRALATRYRQDFFTLYRKLTPEGPSGLDSASIGNRALRNICLSYLMALGEDNVVSLTLEQLETADNMTDALAALVELAHNAHPARLQALADFYARWQDYPLVVDKWLQVQAISNLAGTVANVAALTRHPAYQGDNPNKIHALIGTFCHANPLRFHQPDGSGYRLVAGQILDIDPRNPQVAARLVSAFNLWRRFEPGRRALMRTTLEGIRNSATLSRDVAEIVDRALASE